MAECTNCHNSGFFLKIYTCGDCERGFCSNCLRSYGGINFCNQCYAERASLCLNDCNRKYHGICPICGTRDSLYLPVFTMYRNYHFRNGMKQYYGNFFINSAVQCNNCKNKIIPATLDMIREALQAENDGRYSQAVRLYEKLSLNERAKDVRQKESMKLKDLSFQKGNQFEAHVSRLFLENDFTLLYVTTRRDDLNGRYNEAALNPDFKFKHLFSGHEFWVECKWRSQSINGSLEWCKDYQFKRYKEFQEGNRPFKVYVLIGLGGQASNPNRMFCMPLDDVRYPMIYPSIYEKYERSPTQPFDYRGGRLI
jgi:hypothetical protein